MTRELTIRSFDIPSVHKFGIGFDSMLDELMRATQSQSQTNYPPYNVVKHSEDNFTLELAVAGFKEGDIDIQVERTQLTVKGEQAINVGEPVEYLHRGISARNFIRTWTLADHIEVQSASVADGILTIELVREVPEEMKPKTIAINYNK